MNTTTTDSPDRPPHPSVEESAATWPQTVVGAAVLLGGLGLAWGAKSISSDAGYSGVGPNFFPWLAAIALCICGAWIIWEARTGGYRAMEEPSGAAQAYWPAFAWVSAGLLTNAALITTLGFILSCTLCYLLAVQGLRRANGQAANAPRVWLTDACAGLMLSAPVYWAFTKFLAINLPGLTNTGWL